MCLVLSSLFDNAQMVLTKKNLYSSSKEPEHLKVKKKEDSVGTLRTFFREKTCLENVLHIIHTEGLVC